MGYLQSKLHQWPTLGVCTIHGRRIRQVHDRSRPRTRSPRRLEPSFFCDALSNLSYAAGWSFGGIIAFQVARYLLKSDVPVKGVVLIDSPSPLNHVPLSDALIDSIVNFNRSSIPSNIGLLFKEQFQMNSRMLLDYDPLVGGGPYPQLVLLCSCENYDPGGGLEVPGWLSNGGDRRDAAAGWETISGKPVKCIDIPGHHFQAFHSLYVRFCFNFVAAVLRLYQISSTASAIIEACAFLDDVADH